MKIHQCTYKLRYTQNITESNKNPATCIKVPQHKQQQIAFYFIPIFISSHSLFLVTFGVGTRSKKSVAWKEVVVSWSSCSSRLVGAYGWLYQPLCRQWKYGLLGLLGWFTTLFWELECFFLLLLAVREYCWILILFVSMVVVGKRSWWGQIFIRYHILSTVSSGELLV